MCLVHRREGIILRIATFKQKITHYSNSESSKVYIAISLFSLYIP